MDKFRESLSFEFAAAAVVVMLLVFVPLKAYAFYRSLYGEFAEPKLFVVGALGMAAAFALFVGRGRRVLALVPGLLGGLSGVALYLYLPAPVFMARGDILWDLVFLVGTTPGMLLYWLFRRLGGDSDAA